MLLFNMIMIVLTLCFKGFILLIKGFAYMVEGIANSQPQIAILFGVKKNAIVFNYILVTILFNNVINGS